MFEIVYDDDDDDDDGRRTTDDGRRLDGYTISSPCEPKGSGELKIFIPVKKSYFYPSKYALMVVRHRHYKCHRHYICSIF